MQTAPKSITKMFAKFAASEQSSAILLMICVLLALALANSPSSADYLGIWQAKIGPLHLVHWINDGLMAVFFLLIGLELERELYVGELSSFGNALLPIVAAVGGMAAPALIHLLFNAGTTTQSGFGIPMATDIAFALGVLALLGMRVPVALKVFVVSSLLSSVGAHRVNARKPTALFTRTTSAASDCAKTRRPSASAAASRSTKPLRSARVVSWKVRSSASTLSRSTCAGRPKGQIVLLFGGPVKSQVISR